MAAIPTRTARYLADEIDPILALASRRLRDVDRYEVTEARTCFYTVTDDERFVAHREDRLLALSPCSGHGFKFSALIGERGGPAAGRADRLPELRLLARRGASA